MSTFATLPANVGGVDLDLQPGYHGAIRAKAAAPGLWRRAIITMYEKKTRRIISVTTFVEYQIGKMTLESTGGDVWKYTPKTVPTALNIRAEDKNTGKPMRLIRPVTVRKEPEDTNKKDFYLSAVLADDVKADNSETFSFDDGEVIILQYK
ncbi:hypothetical protein ONZ45_g7095 [Pleurotus djamor]|nr:hypothetical protein ONZ45_g7095 [Pleurotus djamor]